MVIGGITLFVVEVFLWDFDLDSFYLACFALGVVLGLPHVAEHMVEGYKREMQPLEDEKRERWVAKRRAKK